MKLQSLCWPFWALSTLACAAVPDDGLVFSYKDWDLACNKSGQCIAMGYSPGDGIDGISLGLQREAGPNTAVTGTLMFANLGGEPPVPPVQLVIDEVVVGILRDDASDFHVEHDQVLALLAALPGSTQIKVVDSRGAVRTLSDAGAAAVLLKMDEVQERLGTPGALVSRGAEDEQLVPGPRRAAPPIERPPLVENRPEDQALAQLPALRQALRQTLSGPRQCPDLQDPTRALPLTVERLDEQRVLVATQCRANSFNTANGYWVVQDQPPYAAQLVTTEATQFERRMAQISSWQKKRALDDCSTLSFWVWNGAQFELWYRNGYNRCRGFRYGAWGMPTYVR
ncbi:DUF1176 domain-containing protein [Pseudomonas sp. NPDC088890]|uniref:DUF1176 domain-containing protein n=1 Tax=Pseudomonas sp. NPDC088890 TaxID=3364458 RepID=UPI00384D1625